MNAIHIKKLGGRIQSGIIVGVKMENRPDKSGVERNNVQLDVASGVQNTYLVDVGWDRQRGRQLMAVGLWVKLDANGDIIAASTLGALMRFLGVTTVGALIGKEVLLRPKPNRFLAAIGTAPLADDDH